MNANNRTPIRENLTELINLKRESSIGDEGSLQSLRENQQVGTGVDHYDNVEDARFIIPVDEVYLDSRKQLNRIKRGHLTHKQIRRDIEVVRIRLGKKLKILFLC